MMKLGQPSRESHGFGENQFQRIDGTEISSNENDAISRQKALKIWEEMMINESRRKEFICAEIVVITSANSSQLADFSLS